MIGKCFEIVKEDNEDGYGTSVLFPQLKVGVKFKVLRTGAEESCQKHGIKSIILEDGTVIDIDSVDSSFWCLWAPQSMDEIKEIAPESFGSIASTGYFDGQYLPDRLKRIEKEFDAEYNYYDANVIKATIEHIKWLEAQLRFSDRPF
ncbi:hypothetical protein pzkkv8_200 [Klebsiella phage pzk-kv8]|jgi:hypothetical protein|nr:hypothetical protein pzkkv8_200 [Klebsiella phage pzk-kv8]